MRTRASGRQAFHSTPEHLHRTSREGRRRGLVVAGMLAAAQLAVAGQLVRLALQGQGDPQAAMNEPITRTFTRPDIVDRNGRLLATDVESHSLYADPAVVLDRDEVAEKLAQVLPDLDPGELRKGLEDRTRRFVWVRRGLGPVLAQRIHDLGLPGLSFRRELKRVYPAGTLAGHVLGSVNLDNRGIDGIERFIDETGQAEATHGALKSERPPVRLSIDLGVQHAVEDELKVAMERYRAQGASCVLIEARTGEVLASASLPGVDPARPRDALDPERLDKVSDGTYELGSIFKAVTLAMALESGAATLDTVYDVREPLTAGRFTIRDLHSQGRQLTLSEIFIHSSNVGAGMIALDAGTDAQRSFLARLGLTASMKTEAGPVAAAQIPARWDRAETITISYGHGLAVAPIQFAAAGASLVNGGLKVSPTFLSRDGMPVPAEARVVSERTSGEMRTLMRLNVTHRAGTGRRAEVVGYRVGGKTGTADIAGRGGYVDRGVISSFFAAFPMDEPRYVLLVSLFEPKASEDSRGQVAAGLTAAPLAGRVVARAAPLLGVLPDPVMLGADAE